ncbi:MAG: HlyD family efflux transporter periplasmic adaptor subunit [Cyanobacteria bacterium SBC]|nr:HlyD family efflux transporter periplasmic adaptor subunit [Cyanobacteria bacterium SBC]
MKEWQNPTMRRGIAWIAGSTVLAVASVGGWVAYSRRLNSAADTVEVRVLTVERKDVERTVTESGTVRLANQQTLKSPSDATVVEVNVSVGDRVSSGRELVVLRDDKELTQLEEHLLKVRQTEIDVDSKQQQVVNAERNLADARQERDRVFRLDGSADRSRFVERQLEIEQTALKLENERQDAIDARETLATERETLERDRALFDRGFISLNQLQDSENDVRRAESQLREAELQVQTTRLNLESLQASLERYQREIEEATATTETKRLEAEAKVRSAEVALQDALSNANVARLELQQLQLEAQTIEARLQNRLVSAPIGGKVLSINVLRGDVVKLGDDLLTIGNPDREVVGLQLSTLNAKDVRSNQLARISVIGPDEETYTGRVASVSLLANSADTGSTSRRGVSQEGSSAVSATVNLDTPSGTLIPGSQVSVEIVLDRKPNAIALDIEAIQKPDTEPFVWLLDDANILSRQPVTLGLDGLTTIEILSGLEPGDRVAIPPATTELEAGMKALEPE